MSSLEAKFEALMTRLNQQAPKEPTLGEIAYMQTQNALMVNTPLQIEDANYVNNRSYIFHPNHNFPSHYHFGLRNHENLSYGNQAIVPHEPHQLSNTVAPLSFQSQGASSSNYQGNMRQSGFNELFLVINDMKKSTNTRITQLENGQPAMGNVMTSMESIQSTMGTCMKNLEHNQANLSTCMKNMETNQQFGGISQKSGNPNGTIRLILERKSPKILPK